MFTFKLINSSLNSVRLKVRPISSGSGKLLGLFSSEPTPEKATSIEIIDHEEEDSEFERKRIYKLRNKSRLTSAHRNLLHGRVPYANSESWVHETLRYKRKLYAKFGSESKVDPRICFFTKSELHEKNEYEKVAFPKTVLEMIEINEQQKQVERERIAAREANIVKNLMKLENWKKDIQMRREKKDTDARVAKERKDRLIEEVRRHFGFTVDPRDDRFKELLEQKEKAQRKAMKEVKRQEKESKIMAKIASTADKSQKTAGEQLEKDDDDDNDEKKP